MVKQRRRALAPASRASAEAMFSSESLWAKLEQALLGVLMIHLDSGAFVAVEHLCPLQAFVVVRLDHYDVYASRDDQLVSQDMRLTQILTAIKQLSTWAESLRGWDDLSLQLWTRVFRSTMVKYTVDDAWITPWVRYVKANGVHLQLRWEGATRQQDILQDQLPGFPQACQSSKKRLQSVTIGLHVKSGQFTASDVVWHHEMLRGEDTRSGTSHGTANPTKTFAVRELTFTEVAFQTQALNALAELLEDPSTAPIDELHLSGYIISRTYDGQASSEELEVFRRIVVAALTSKGPHDKATVSLTLKWTSPFQTEHVEALQTAIQTATRPLRKLSLGTTRVHDACAAKQLGTLLFSRVFADENGCHLDLKDATFLNMGSFGYEEDSVFDGLAELVEETIVQCYQEDTRVECQCFPAPEDLNEDGRRMTAFNFVAGQFYEVQQVRDAGKEVGLAGPVTDESQTTPSVTWVSSRLICAVRSADGQVLVGWGFSGLTLGSFNRWVRVAGSQLRRLELHSKGSWRWDAGAIRLLGRCVNLRELHVVSTQCATEDGTPFWDHLPPSVAASLLVLRVPGCDLKASHIANLCRLTRLRYLDLTRNSEASSAEGLTNLLQVVRATPSLQCVVNWSRGGVRSFHAFTWY